MWTSAWRVSSVQSTTTRYRESQVSLAVDIVVDRTFTSWGVDLRVHTYSSLRKFFVVCGLDREIILTAKIYDSRVVLLYYAISF